MPQVSENVTWKKVGDNYVLLNLTDSNYYVLNETATVVFRGMLNGETAEQIAASLCEEYACSYEQAFADVTGVFQYLAQEKLLMGVES